LQPIHAAIMEAIARHYQPAIGLATDFAQRFSPLFA
jgi:hypothetical protein